MKDAKNEKWSFRMHELYRAEPATYHEVCVFREMCEWEQIELLGELRKEGGYLDTIAGVAGFIAVISVVIALVAPHFEKGNLWALGAAAFIVLAGPALIWRTEWLRREGLRYKARALSFEDAFAYNLGINPNEKDFWIRDTESIAKSNLCKWNDVTRQYAPNGDYGRGSKHR